MNVLSNFVIFVIISTLFCHVALVKLSKLSEKFFAFFSISRAHKKLKSVMGLLIIYRSSYVLIKLSNCEAVDF